MRKQYGPTNISAFYSLPEFIKDIKSGLHMATAIYTDKGGTNLIASSAIKDNYPESTWEDLWDDFDCVCYHLSIHTGTQMRMAVPIHLA